MLRGLLKLTYTINVLFAKDTAFHVKLTSRSLFEFSILGVTNISRYVVLSFGNVQFVFIWWENWTFMRPMESMDLMKAKHFLIFCGFEPPLFLLAVIRSGV